MTFNEFLEGLIRLTYEMCQIFQNILKQRIIDESVSTSRIVEDIDENSFDSPRFDKIASTNTLIQKENQLFTVTAKEIAHYIRKYFV